MPSRDPAADPIRIERFDPRRHDRSTFDCGVARLNNYLKLSAKKQQLAEMTRVYVATAENSRAILGYHAINMGHLDAQTLERPPKGAPKHGEIPILFLGQVAVDRGQQGKGLGAVLMIHALHKAVVLSDEVGCYAVLLDVMSDGGPQAFERRKAWYASFGFQSLPSLEHRMFVTMREVRSILTLE